MGEPLLYVASRASHPARPAMWRGFRDLGWRIVSSWIDEAGPGETADMGELWARIGREIREADGLILYAEPADFPLKGALIEAGMALALGKPVAVVLPGGIEDGRSCRPIGSWVHHPLCRVFTSMVYGKAWIAGARGING